MSPAEHEARTPGWAPIGWLVYYDVRLRALALLNPTVGLEADPFNYFPTSLGIIGSWSPDGTHLVYPDIVFPEAENLDEQSAGTDGTPLYFSHLYLVDVTSGRTQDISPGEDWMVEDASPTYSPDGNWVAFTRKFLDPERWSPGRQVWLMKGDKTDIQPLTDEPNATFSSLAWSPDSRRLAFMRKEVSNLSRPSEIWWVDVNSGEARPRRGRRFPARMDPVIPLDGVVPDFQAYDLAGVEHSLFDERGQILILVFWSTECPWSTRADALLQNWQTGWDEETTLWMIAANSNESPGVFATSRRVTGLKTVLLDRDQETGRSTRRSDNAPLLCDRRSWAPALPGGDRQHELRQPRGHALLFARSNC